jgi:hypothetical protein
MALGMNACWALIYKLYAHIFHAYIFVSAYKQKQICATFKIQTYDYKTY